MMKIIFILLLLTCKTFALDNLSLNGLVKDYFPLTNELKIEVKNGSCKGERYFVINSKLIKKEIIGKKIYFTIDSNTCEKNQKYKIIEFSLEE